MTDPEKILFKNKLKLFALALIGQRIAAAKGMIDQAQQAANNEEKSSAGDKYETGRAMGHLQKDMHARQLAESMKELAALHSVHTDLLYPAAGPGAFVQAEGIAFFIAAGLGRQQHEGQTILFLSPQAPLAKVLQDKKQGDDIAFLGRTVRILEIF